MYNCLKIGNKILISIDAASLMAHGITFSAISDLHLFLDLHQYSLHSSTVLRSDSVFSMGTSSGLLKVSMVGANWMASST